MTARTWQLIWMALVVAVVVLWVRSGAAPNPVSAAPSAEVGDGGQLAPLPGGPPSASLIVVHVTGAVATPGLVRLPASSRVADAVAAAGGITAMADTGSVNLAAALADGVQIHIPHQGEDVRVGDAPAGNQSDRVAINQATAADLQRLPGVGPVLAGRIVDYRDAHGPFTVVEDLLDVPGIGEGRLAELRDRVVIP